MTSQPAGPDLAAIASAASRETGGVPVELLGDYLPAVAEAAASGRRLTAAELTGYGRSGEQAALSGVALRGLVDLFLSATWRLWRELPAGTSLVAVRAACSPDLPYPVSSAAVRRRPLAAASATAGR